MPTTKPTSSASAAGTQTIHRAVTLLRLITVNNRNGIRLVDLYRHTGMERPTTHRILQGLIAEKLAQQDPQSKRYYLGSLVYEMGLAATPPLAMRDVCKPYLQTIADKTGGTVFMTIRSGFDGVCVARADGTSPLKIFTHDIGRHRPLNVGAGGMALLSAMSDEDINRICHINIERTISKNPRFSENALRADIDATRKRGYALTKVMNVPAAQSIGIAVRHPDGTPAAGISVSALMPNFDLGQIDAVAQCIRDAVGTIEGKLASAAQSI